MTPTSELQHTRFIRLRNLWDLGCEAERVQASPSTIMGIAVEYLACRTANTGMSRNPHLKSRAVTDQERR